MIRIRIEFLEEQDRQAILKILDAKYKIAECSRIRESKIEGNEFKMQYLTIVPKHE